MVLASSGFAGSSVLSASEKNAVMKSVKELADASVKGDFSVMINKIPDQLVKHMGVARKSMASSVKLAMETARKSGFAITSYKCSDPVAAYQCKQSKVVFVPAKIVMSVGKKVSNSTTYLVVSRNKGSKK